MTDGAPHVLVVGGGREIPGRIRGLGARTTTLCRQVVLDSVREPEANVSVHALPDDSPAEWWVELASVLHRRDPFTAVASFSELDQDKAAAVAAALGLSWHSPETVAAVHDKLRMRTVLAEHGVDDVLARPVHSVADVVAAGEAVGWPVVVKPVSGWASAGVSVVPGPEAAQAAIDRAAAAEVHQGHDLMVEQYVPGREYSVEALSEDGVHLVVGITEKDSDPRTRIEVGHLVPARVDAQLADDIARFVSAVLTALGVRSGLSHTEIMVTGEGDLHVIETHVRPAGDEIPELVADALGVDLVGAAIRQTLGEAVLAEVRDQLAGGTPRHAAIRFVLPGLRAQVVDVEGVEEARKVPGVVDVRVTVGPGDELAPAEDSFGRAAQVRAVGDSADDALEAVGRAASTIGFVVRITGSAVGSGSATG